MTGDQFAHRRFFSMNRSTADGSSQETEFVVEGNAHVMTVGSGCDIERECSSVGLNLGGAEAPKKSVSRMIRSGTVGT